MRGKGAIGILLTYGWVILISLIILSVLCIIAYYSIFAPTSRDFGPIEVMPIWSMYAINGGMSLHLHDRTGVDIVMTGAIVKIDNVNIAYTVSGDGSIASGDSRIVDFVTPSWTVRRAGDFYATTVSLTYTDAEGAHETSGTISGVYC